MSETRERLQGLDLAGNTLLGYQAQLVALAATGFGSVISLPYTLHPSAFGGVVPRKPASHSMAVLPWHCSLVEGTCIRWFRVKHLTFPLLFCLCSCLHLGFVLEQGDPTFVLTEPEHQSYM